MIHVHKEILITYDGQEVWSHADTVYLKLYDKGMLKKFVDNCFENNKPEMTPLTRKDVEFTLPDHVYTITDIIKAKECWDSVMPTPFNYHFGCWPWDYADQLTDPQLRKDLKEMGILDFRMVVLL